MWWDRSSPPKIIIIQTFFIVNIIVNASMNIIIIVIVFRRTRLVAWLVREIFGFSLALEGEVDNRISIFFWKVWHWPRDIKFCQEWARSKNLFEFSFSNTPLYFLSLSSHLRWYSLSRQNPGGRMSAPQKINTALMAPLVIQCRLWHIPVKIWHTIHGKVFLSMTYYLVFRGEKVFSDTRKMVSGTLY